MGTFSILFRMALGSTPPIFSFLLIFPIFFLFLLDYNVRPPGAASPTAQTTSGGSNAALSNATWRIKLESCLKSRLNSTWVGRHERLYLFRLWTKVHHLFFAQRGRGYG